MENPFKKLDHPPREVPKELKKKVIDDINAFKLFTEITGLFTSNYTKALESFFKKRQNNRDQK